MGRKIYVKKICVKRYVLGISLVYKAELKKILVGYLVKTFIKSRKR